MVNIKIYYIFYDIGLLFGIFIELFQILFWC